MIALKDLPEHFIEWNRKLNAPYGEPYFCYEPNNSTRQYEYPWAFFATPIQRGQRVLEIGGALSGFQFVLSSFGCDVVNVDPGRPARGNIPACDHATMAMLNRRFNTSVVLKHTTMEKAELQPDFFDFIFSISVIEHISEDKIESVMLSAYRCLKPGGYFIMTIDLFLNIFPFTSRKENKHGKNIDVRRLIEIAPFEVVYGKKSELNGYPGFDRDKIQGRLAYYYYGNLYPTLIQCVVLKKPG